ncbi:hypothetical protein [Polymorphum gilvum]|uniref:Uncharacterized protein n=1 Tax=Polymorphum gilvum (strain LMG 25793 / CGMCC 1.9160 / SL003B-26A1) TaxID=991905 RepID=F2J347_POLGS|nr:hypothetical protein [Polymorphum gilvum]ADZ69854.1 hypothetical protein SL003B_1426 [Polymorphum gilvum SL003B-26A1]
MQRELDLVGSELDTVLAGLLGRWAEDLGGERTCADYERLYCLYPRIASHIAWARASLKGASQAAHQVQAMREAGPEGHAGVEAMAGGGCCPCCGGTSGLWFAGGPSAARGGCGCGCGGRGHERSGRSCEEHDDVRNADRFRA